MVRQGTSPVQGQEESDRLEDILNARREVVILLEVRRTVSKTAENGGVIWLDLTGLPSRRGRKKQLTWKPSSTRMKHDES